MSAYSSSLVQMSGCNGISAKSYRPVLRPIFYVLRPNGLIVPLFPMDELPEWLEFVTDYGRDFDVRTMYPASARVYPRLGEYDILCVYCENTREHFDDNKLWQTSRVEELDHKTHALARRHYPPSTYPTSYYHNTTLWRTFPGDNVLPRPSYLYRTARTPLNPQANVFKPSSEARTNGAASGVSPKSLGKSNSTTYTPNSWFALSPNLQPGPYSDDSSHTEYEDIFPANDNAGMDNYKGQVAKRRTPDTTFHAHPEVRNRDHHRRLSKPSSGSSQSLRRDLLRRANVSK